MGFNAYHDVDQYVHIGDERHEDLIMDGAMLTKVTNRFYVCSAYEPDKVETPLDKLQDFMARKHEFSERETFTLMTEEINELIDEIAEGWPGHPEAESVTKTLRDLIARDEGCDDHDIVCY